MAGERGEGFYQHTGARDYVAAGDARHFEYDRTLGKLKDFVSGTEFGSPRYLALSDYIQARAAKERVTRLRHDLAAGAQTAENPVAAVDPFTFWYKRQRDGAGPITPAERWPFLFGKVTGGQKNAETVPRGQERGSSQLSKESALRIEEQVYANFITRARIHIDMVPGYKQELTSLASLTKGYAKAVKERYQFGDPFAATEKVTDVLDDLKATIPLPAESTLKTAYAA